MIDWAPNPLHSDRLQGPEEDPLLTQMQYVLHCTVQCCRGLRPYSPFPLRKEETGSSCLRLVGLGWVETYRQVMATSPVAVSHSSYGTDGGGTLLVAHSPSSDRSG